MNHSPMVAQCGAKLMTLAALVAAWPAAAPAQTINFATSPLFLGSTIKPNVLVVYDNSQSMDGTMAGKLIAGSDASTRGNIARTVLRDTITTYRNNFQWGLASFDLGRGGLYTTYAYYFGADGANGTTAQVVYTNDCVGGISATNGGRRCVANPQNGNGYNFITYARSGDDPDINDVLYTDDSGPQMYGIGVSDSTDYTGWLSHGNNNGWIADSFSGRPFGLSFTPTDAGFLPGTYPRTSNYYPRIFWLRRAWGYNYSITGAGTVNRSVQADAAAHYDALMALLATETDNTGTTELKNGAVYTPLAGTLDTVRSYFAGTLSGKSSPITESCQKNFVLLATDGNPTGKTNGDMYRLDEMANTYNAATATWSFGTASRDVFSRITALGTTSYGGRDYKVQTYVIGLGDSVANASSVATLNRMASLGETSQAYLASDQDALAAAFRAISIDIIARTAAASSVTVNTASISNSSKAFQGRFSSSDWSGQLLAYPLGNDGSPGNSADWDAGQRLNAQSWNNGRQILTYKPSAALGARGVPFRWPANSGAPGATEIDPGLVTALNKNGSGTVDGFGSQRLEFLRGNTAREARNCAACAAPVFRDRAVSVLGDIVNSAPVYVGGAVGDYRDTMQVDRFSTYASGRSGQTPMIYVGANDGMLHAFNASNGNEVFAYVPWAVRNRLSGLTTNPYTHKFTVDGSPSVGDVYYGGGWKTLLVSGMNAGAPGLFALDISAQANFTEANAARVARWEISDSDGDVGYIFSRPLLAKTKDGRWRAIVGNGYNSANGHAVLLLVDLETGAVARIDTGVGTAAVPNGLSAVSAISTADNGVVDTVYAGDLYGNLWKFDLTASAVASWAPAFGASGAWLPLFTAAAGQAITARPDVTRSARGGYMVTFGTGRYVDVGDNSTSSTQALYGIWDNAAPVAMADLQTQTIVSTAASGGKTYRLSTYAVGTPTDTAIAGDGVITLAQYNANKKGWKLNLPTSGERVVADVAVRNGRLGVSTLIPSTAVCSFGGDGWLIEVDAATGNRSAAFDTTGDNQVNAGDRVSGTVVSGVKVGAVPAAATVLRGSGTYRGIDYKLVTTSDGAPPLRQSVSGTTATSRRAAWEQLQ